MPRKYEPYSPVEDLRARDPGLRLLVERLHINQKKRAKLLERPDAEESISEELAIKKIGPCTQEELGALLDPQISRQAVNRWRRVPGKYCQTVARLLKVKPYELRPDLYPEPPPRRPKPLGRETVPA